MRSIATYQVHLDATRAWIDRSLRPRGQVTGRGGSSAYATAAGTWSRVYPETTGYLIPTLLSFKRTEEVLHIARWLLLIQHPDGWWAGGLHPPRRPLPSVFNTAQVLSGLVTLARTTNDLPLRSSITRAARWLAAGIAADGLWPNQDYRALSTPTYYTHAAWPLLEAAHFLDDDTIGASALRVLNALSKRRLSNGGFAGWSFTGSGPAFTHTIAYTLRGLIGAAESLNTWEPYGAATESVLERLGKSTELTGGRLPGLWTEDLEPLGSFVCLTGNAQLAICLLIWESRHPDLRIVNMAAKLLDVVCASQRLRHPLSAIRGAVGGSLPLAGPYMRGRYPNWAAKFHCDALGLMIRRLEGEAASWRG